MSNAVHEGNMVDNLWTYSIAVNPTNTDALFRVIALTSTASAAKANRTKRRIFPASEPLTLIGLWQL
jgi:hypothetical protein